MGWSRRGEAANCPLEDSRPREHWVNFKIHVTGIKTVIVSGSTERFGSINQNGEIFGRGKKENKRIHLVRSLLNFHVCTAVNSGDMRQVEWLGTSEPERLQQ